MPIYTFILLFKLDRCQYCSGCQQYLAMRPSARCSWGRIWSLVCGQKHSGAVHNSAEQTRQLKEITERTWAPLLHARYIFVRVYPTYKECFVSLSSTSLATGLVSCFLYKDMLKDMHALSFPPSSIDKKKQGAAVFSTSACVDQRLTSHSHWFSWLGVAVSFPATLLEGQPKSLGEHNALFRQQHLSAVFKSFRFPQRLLRH